MLERVLVLSSPAAASDLLGLEEDSLGDDSPVTLNSSYVERERKEREKTLSSLCWLEFPSKESYF